LQNELPAHALGLFLDLGWPEYLALEAVNHGRLADFARSPAACRLRMSEPEEPTRAMLLGTALHAALFEEETFAERWGFLEHDGRTAAGKQERQQAAERGRQMLTRDDFAAVVEMARSLLTHPRVLPLMLSASAREETAIWRAPQGRLCKARRDLVGPGWIADVKSTSAFERFSPWQVTNFGYYRQAAWYAWGGELLQQPCEHFFLLVVANSAPFESAVYRLSQEAMRAGRAECERLLELYLACEASGRWPRHVTELLTADVAGLRLAEIEEGGTL